MPPTSSATKTRIALARDMPEVVARALQMKKIGNDIVTTLGGREIHPINVRVGGFYRVPRKEELTPLLERLPLGPRPGGRDGPTGGGVRVSGVRRRLRIRVASARRKDIR